MSEGTHVYHIDAVRLLALPVVWLVCTVALLTLAGSETTTGAREAGLLALLIVTAIMAPIYYFGVWRSRLVLDAQGISHHQLGYVIRSDWSNVARLDLTAGVEGLHLHAPGTRSRLLGAAVRVVRVLSATLGVGSVVGDYDALAEGRFIALMPFNRQLRDGPLGRDLERWAPHLSVAGERA